MEPFVLDAADLGFVPPDRPYWTSPEMIGRWGSAGPLYTNQTVAAFFGRSTPWLKLVLWQRPECADVLDVIQPPRTDAGHLRWRLYDVERLAHCLLEREIISFNQWLLVLNVVKNLAVLNHYDVGDRRLKHPLDEEMPRSQQRALALVTRRLREQDSGEENSNADSALEHLISHAAWAVEKLANHLEGVRDDTTA